MPQNVTRPDGTAAIFVSCLRLYVRFPLLFAVIAFGVVAPFDLLVFGLGGTSPGGTGSGSLDG